MIVCRICSRRFTDAPEFCSCGAYLEYDGQVVADEGAAGGAGDDAGNAAGSATDTTRRAPPSGAAEVGGSEGRWALGGSATPNDGMSAVVPSEGQRTTRGTGPAPAPTQTRPGDLVCPSCSTASPQGSTFCRHCGHDLTGLAPRITSEPTSDKRKRRRFGRRSVDPVSAARMARTPPQGLAGNVMLFRIGAGLLGAGLLTMLLVRPMRAGMTDRLPIQIYDQIETGEALAEPVVQGEVAEGAVADDATATEFTYRLPEHAFDLALNTAWATRWLDPSDPGRDLAPDPDCVPWKTEEVLFVELDSETDIDRVRVLSGRMQDDPGVEDFARPSAIQFQHDDTCRRITIEPEGEITIHDLSFDNVDSLLIGPVAIVESETGDLTVEISEIVLEKR